MDDSAAQHAQPDIPDKLYFRIGEVSRLAGIKPYVLRFWESEFPTLGPKKSGTGHRLYRRKDVELVFAIKRLLYQERFTIEGARKYLDANPASVPVAAPVLKPAPAPKPEPPPFSQGELFEIGSPAWLDIRRELAEILELLNSSR